MSTDLSARERAWESEKAAWDRLRMTRGTGTAPAVFGPSQPLGNPQPAAPSKMSPERRADLLRHVGIVEEPASPAPAVTRSLSPGARALLATLPDGRAILAEDAARDRPATFSGESGKPLSARAIELLKLTEIGRGHLRSLGIAAP
jgi:hypothetical protein